MHLRNGKDCQQRTPVKNAASIHLNSKLIRELNEKKNKKKKKTLVSKVRIDTVLKNKGRGY